MKPSLEVIAVATFLLLAASCHPGPEKPAPPAVVVPPPVVKPPAIEPDPPPPQLPSAEAELIAKLSLLVDRLDRKMDRDAAAVQELSAKVDRLTAHEAPPLPNRLTGQAAGPCPGNAYSRQPVQRRRILPWRRG